MLNCVISSSSNSAIYILRFLVTSFLTLNCCAPLLSLLRYSLCSSPSVSYLPFSVQGRHDNAINSQLFIHLFVISFHCFVLLSLSPLCLYILESLSTHLSTGVPKQYKHMSSSCEGALDSNIFIFSIWYR